MLSLPQEGCRACLLHPPELWLLTWLPSSSSLTSTLGKLEKNQDPGRWHSALVAVEEATARALAEDSLNPLMLLTQQLLVWF